MIKVKMGKGNTFLRYEVSNAKIILLPVLDGAPPPLHGVPCIKKMQRKFLKRGKHFYPGI